MDFIVLYVAQWYAHCFIEQNISPSLLCTDWFQEEIKA